MQSKPTEKWAPRGAAFVVALLLGASAAYWVLHWPAPASESTGAPALVLAPSALPAPDVQAVATLLGATGATGNAGAVPEVSRFQLVGVLARSSGEGSAIISVDGAPAKSFRVGSEIADGVRLQSVAPRRATVAGGPGGAPAQTLELPAPLNGR